MRKAAILKLISSLLGGAAAHTGANGPGLKDQLRSTKGLLEGTTP